MNLSFRFIRKISRSNIVNLPRISIRNCHRSGGVGWRTWIVISTLSRCNIICRRKIIIRFLRSILWGWQWTLYLIRLFRKSLSRLLRWIVGVLWCSKWRRRERHFSWDFMTYSFKLNLPCLWLRRRWRSTSSMKVPRSCCLRSCRLSPSQWSKKFMTYMTRLTTW